MLGIFNKKKKPFETDNHNPGLGPTLKVAFSKSEKDSCGESDNLVELLSKILKQKNIKHRTFSSWIKLNSNLYLEPQVVAIHPLETDGVNTTTTIGVHFVADNGFSLFEYQHATGDDCRKSILNGFDTWSQTDLIAILDATSQSSKDCTVMEMQYPEKKTTRVMILGPVFHYAKLDSNNNEGEDHRFCPCCFLTNSFDAFRNYLEDDKVYGVRFFAMRNENGEVQADCRINGIDFEEGKAALIDYGKHWPNRGVEFRKQFVMMKSVPLKVVN